MNIKRILKNATPFIILSILAILAFAYILIVEGGGPEGMGALFFVFTLAAIAIMAAVDLSLKHLKVKRGGIWLIEVLLLLACIYWWIIT